MSGSLISPTASMTVADGRSGVFPVSFGLYPQEGSRAVYAQYDWTSRVSYTEDLSRLVDRGIETTIQSAFFDNSKVSAYVTLTVGGTGQVLVVPPSSQAILPLFFTGTPLFSIAVGATQASVTRVILLNVPMQSSAVWQAVS